MKKCLLIILVVFGLNSFVQAQYDLTVAQDGTGNHSTVQAAITAAPTGRTTPYKILIKKGKYREKISIPSNKPFIYLIGEDVGTVTLSWDDFSGKPMPGGGTFGTSNSATVTINAPDCAALNITFENTTGDAPQALAINVNATRCAFKNCRFLGGQDTVLTNGGGNLQYFKNCYIDGVVDFIFGAAVAVFDSCIVYPKTRLDNLSGSYITAANTPAGQNYGYVFRDCVMPNNRGTTTYVLGRPWQNDGTSNPPSNTKTVFINTTMSAVVKPQGWDVWNSNTNTSIIYYGEYRSRKFDSGLVDVSQRVPWSFQLTATEAATYTLTNIFGSWNPCAAFADNCSFTPTPLVTSNFRGVKGVTNSTFTWNISWPMAGVKYEIFRSTDRQVFSKVAEQTSPNNVDVNYNYQEAIPPPGLTYFYYVWSSKTGSTSHSSDTIAISSTPTINVTGTMGSFLQGLGTPSAVQTYTLSGVNLLNSVSITAPAGYEISSNNGTSWNNSSTPIVINQDANGNIANRVISVRLNSTTAGAYNGNIVHTSSGAVTVNFALTGTVQTNPLAISETLIHWPLVATNIDDASVRSTGVVATVPTFNKLFVSNGTTVTVVPAYSTTHGQAFGASSNGDGSWGTASPVFGPGGNLNRTFYEEFKIQASNSSTVRVDSFIVTSSFYNTSSNTRLAVVYSKSAFVTDSANITGGIGADGLSMVFSPNGTFTNAVALTNQTAATTTNFRFALNGATGVSLAPNETLTVRLYFSCGSTSTGRYAKVKDAIFKGLANNSLPATITNFTASTERNLVQLKWNTINEINVAEFAIERSDDGRNFKTIGTEKAKNISSQQNYWFNDIEPLNGVAYYKLKIIDKDGKFNYSKTIIVNTNIKSNVSIYPNPAKSVITITYPKVSSNSTMIISTVEGKKVLVQTLMANSTQSNINIASLTNGNYLVTIASGNEIITQKFTKQ